MTASGFRYCVFLLSLLLIFLILLLSLYTNLFNNFRTIKTIQSIRKYTRTKKTKKNSSNQYKCSYLFIGDSFVKVNFVSSPKSLNCRCNCFRFPALCLFLLNVPDGRRGLFTDEKFLASASHTQNIDNRNNHESNNNVYKR